MAFNAIATTGLQPLTMGSNYLFVIQPYRDGLPWDISSGQAWITLTDPAGTDFVFPATIVGFAAQVAWLASGIAGEWQRHWKIIAGGITQFSNPVPFSIVQP